MMEEEASSSINLIRAAKCSDLKEIRQRHKEDILSHRRIGLQKFDDFVQDISLSEFKELVLKVKKKSVTIDVLRKIKNSCVHLDYIQAVFKTDGAINSFVRILIGKDAHKQLEAAACLVNLACGPHKCSYKVAKTSGAYFVTFMDGDSYFLQDLSAWAVGNIANDCVECYNLVKAQGALLALFKLLKSPYPNVVQSAVFALNACSKYEDPDIITLVQSGLPKQLCHILEEESNNRSLVLDSAFALSNICYLSSKYSWKIFDAQAVEKIICILTKVTENTAFDILVSLPLVRCLGFLSCNDETCELISKHTEFHNTIQSIALSDCLPLKKELIWLLSNIAVSRMDSSASVYLTLIIDSLGPFLKMENSATLQVLRYLLCVISKDTSIIPLLKEKEIFPPIQCLLTSRQNDVSEAAKLFLEVTQC